MRHCAIEWQLHHHVILKNDIYIYIIFFKGFFVGGLKMNCFVIFSHGLHFSMLGHFDRDMAILLF